MSRFGAVRRRPLHPDQLLSRRGRILSLALLLPATGCIPLDGATSADVTGTVAGQEFFVESGSAELNVDSKYVITLADTPAFACNASNGLPPNYVTVVIGEIDTPETFEADGRVFFNSFVDGVSEGEPADSGTVVVDSVTPFRIDGTIDATGPTSSVSGDFSVEICP